MGQVSLRELLYPVRGDKALFTFHLPFFLFGSSIYCNRFKKSSLIVIEDVCLRSANLWIYLRRALWPIPE
jgi:hypothetical protein